MCVWTCRGAAPGATLRADGPPGSPTVHRAYRIKSGIGSKFLASVIRIRGLRLQRLLRRTTQDHAIVAVALGISERQLGIRHLDVFRAHAKEAADGKHGVDLAILA